MPAEHWHNIFLAAFFFLRTQVGRQTVVFFLKKKAEGKGKLVKKNPLQSPSLAYRGKAANLLLEHEF